MLHLKYSFTWAKVSLRLNLNVCVREGLREREREPLNMCSCSQFSTTLNGAPSVSFLFYDHPFSQLVHRG